MIYTQLVVIGVVNEYHLILTPVFFYFKPPSIQKKKKILKRSISYYFKKFFQLDNHKSCIISKVSQLEHYISYHEIRQQTAFGWKEVHNELSEQPFCHNRQQLVRIIICLEYNNCRWEVLHGRVCRTKKTKTKHIFFLIL